MNVVVILSKDIFAEGKKASTPSDFARKVKTGAKRHTVRANFDYWRERIERLQQRGGVLSLRQWSGKPYEKGSTQELIMDVPASMVEVQRLVMSREQDTESEVLVDGSDGVFAKATDTEYRYFAEVEGHHVPVETLAKNDGLTLEDFKAWFNPVFDEYESNVQVTKNGVEIKPSKTSLTFAVIQFTTFRY